MLSEIGCQKRKRDFDMFCKNCGTEILDGMSFCPECGTSVDINRSVDRIAQEANYTGPQCPKCGGTNIAFQREQTASVGAGTNRVVIQEAKKRRGCMYWVCCGWLFELIYWMCIGWWKNLFFGGKKRGGLNFHADKAINRTVAVCQSCGHSWKVK